MKPANPAHTANTHQRSWSRWVEPARRYLTTTEASDTGTSAIEPTTKITPSRSMSRAAATNTPSSATPSAHATSLQRRPGSRPSGNSSGTNSAYASRAVSHVQLENQPTTVSPRSPDSAYIPLTVPASTPIGTAQNSQPTALCGSRRAISTPSTVKPSMKSPSSTAKATPAASASPHFRASAAAEASSTSTATQTAVVSVLTCAARKSTPRVSPTARSGSVTKKGRRHHGRRPSSPAVTGWGRSRSDSTSRTCRPGCASRSRHAASRTRAGRIGCRPATA